MNTDDFLALRAQYPTLADRTYFATHSFGPVPRGLFDELEEYRRSLLLGKRALPVWVGRMYETVGLIEALLHAPAGSIALRDNATAAQGAIAAAIEPRGGRDGIVITALDFHSSRYLWKAQARRGFRVEELTPERGEVSAERLVAAIDERTAVVAVSLVSPRTGAMVDIAPVIRAARAHGAIVVLDAYQALGCVPLDVQALDVDVLVGGTAKWLGSGSGGLAFMYVRPALADALEPAFPGWFAHASVATSFGEGFRPAPGAARFQSGTPAVEPMFSARAGLRLALEVGAHNVRARHVAATGRMIERALARGLPVTTPRRAEARGSVVCFDVADAEAITTALEARGIDVDWRPGAGVRASPHHCLPDEASDQVVDAIAEQVEARRARA